MSKLSTLSRRRVLRGMLGGGAVTISLPLLNCFLNDNGTALASGAPIPLRFGTWQWGLGMSEAIFVPKKTGANFDLPLEIQSLKPIQQHINLFTNFVAYKDAAPNLCHHTGWVILRSGMAPATKATLPGESIDSTIAKKIGNTTRIRNLSATATGDIRDSYSYEGGNQVNTPEFSPVRMYQRLFSGDFQDPNADEFTPDPKVMVRKSVLSSVADESRVLNRQLGAEDRARLEQYFAAVRDLERRFDMQMERPDPRPACTLPSAPAPLPVGVEAMLLSERHRMMTDLMLMAVACDQTRVFNMFTTTAFASTTKPGYDLPHHTATHEEAIVESEKCQPNCSWYTRRAMEEWAYFVGAMAKIKEGDGTLLDNSLVYATTDQSLAKTHDIEGIPMFTAGTAGGRLKTGLHISGERTPNTRLGYTLLRVMGVETSAWGTQSNNTSKEIGDILA